MSWDIAFPVMVVTDGGVWVALPEPELTTIVKAEEDRQAGILETFAGT